MAKEKPWRRDPRQRKSLSSISSWVPYNLVLPHRMTSNSDDGEPAATLPATVA